VARAMIAVQVDVAHDAFDESAPDALVTRT
jgi:hypothetical protein